MQPMVLLLLLLLHHCKSEQKLCRSGNTFLVKGTTLMDGVLPVFQGCGPFQFHENIKPQSPFNVTAVASPGGYNISWESAYTGYNYLHGELQYQLRFRQKGHTWQGPKHLLQDTRNLWLLPQELQGATEYELQVRTRPRDQSDYKGIWSDWSPQSSLRTLPRDTGGAAWLVTAFALILLAALVVVFLCWHQRQWKLEKFIPNPAPFFQTLYLVHNGDFKKWAGSCGAVRDVCECGAGLAEVRRASRDQALRPRPDEAAAPAPAPAPSSSCIASRAAFAAEGRLAFPEAAAYGHLSILDTVSVAHAGPEASRRLDDGGSPSGAWRLSALCGPPCGEPGPAEPPAPPWAAAAWAAVEGDAGEGLDLDTVDSGFADSECGSPGQRDEEDGEEGGGGGALEGRPAGGESSNAAANAAAAALLLPSYVKQWVAAAACHGPPGAAQGR